MSKNNPRLRFAPSPTGSLSLANARTALFNWLYAKHEGGKFLLRIEDTDQERSEKEHEESIINGLKWLGLEWDEKIYRQSNRLDLYKEYLEKLLEDGDAYWCFCSTEKLEKEREKQKEKGLAPTYPGTCRNISLEEAREKLDKGENAVIRYKMPKKKIKFNDIIRGEVEFHGREIGDFVIATSKDRPLYNFAVVIDDHEMDITHVVRGEDHLSNTPRQLAIYKTLGFDHPEYAHLPLILSPEGGKLSKRFREGALIDYKENGYVADALFNFMALLGWHPKEDKEVIGRQEAIKEFTLDRVQKGGASLDMDKLDWYNGYYIRNMDTKELMVRVEDFIPDEWLRDKEKLRKALEIEKDRMKKLIDFKEKASFFFDLPDYDKGLIVWKEKAESSQDSLKKIYDFLEDKSELNPDNLKEFLEEVSENKGGRGEVYWPLRAALSGQEASPGPVEIAGVLGLEEVRNRVKLAIEKF